MAFLVAGANGLLIVLLVWAIKRIFPGISKRLREIDDRFDARCLYCTKQYKLDKSKNINYCPRCGRVQNK